MSGPHKTIAEAQLAVSGERGKYPEFRGNVLTVQTRDFWREPEVSPRVMVQRDFEFLSTSMSYWKEDLRADVLLLGDAVPQTPRGFSH